MPGAELAVMNLFTALACFIIPVATAVVVVHAKEELSAVLIPDAAKLTMARLGGVLQLGMASVLLSGLMHLRSALAVLTPAVASRFLPSIRALSASTAVVSICTAVLIVWLLPATQRRLASDSVSYSACEQQVGTVAAAAVCKQRHTGWATACRPWRP